MTAWEWLKQNSQLQSGTAWELLTHPKEGGGFAGECKELKLNFVPEDKHVTMIQENAGIMQQELSSHLQMRQTETIIVVTHETIEIEVNE